MKGIVILATVFLYALVWSAPTNNKPKKWALLLANSKDWVYYRHQANICHAYQTLIANGFPRENIIVMMYADIAYHNKNNERGIIRNHPSGPNVYAGVKMDYTGQDVNRTIFLAVLNGDKATVRGIGSGRVIESGPKDVIFINIVGLGSHYLISFPSGPPLYQSTFIGALESLRKKNRCRKILLHVETPYAASLFDGYLSRRNNILVSAAANSLEWTWPVYCVKEKRICYGGLYGVAWTEHMDRMRQLRAGVRETLFNHFQHVRTQTVYSHVDLYGHLEIGHGRVSEFLYYKYQPKQENSTNNVADAEDISLEESFEENEEDIFDEEPNNFNGYENEVEDKDVGIDYTGMKEGIVSDIDALSYALDDDEEGTDGDTNGKLENILKNRNFVDDTINKIIEELSHGNDFASLESIEKVKGFPDEEAHKCYKSSVEAFDELCFSLNENSYVLRHLHKLLHLCMLGVHETDIAAAIESKCTQLHRISYGIH